ncbi:MAG TPA: saccharopine dehydrogenase NADP-binding domain-containing protein, partial [Solirubrobacterales bacterium]
MEANRRYDLALFGATGFTGGLTARYLAEHGPANLRWALVGRNRAKLEAVAARLAELDSAVPAPELLEADAADREALRKVAEAAKVVVTTVGPYALYGEPLVAACAAAGTDYVDLPGEPEFVDRMWLEHHAEAERT